MGQGSHFQKLPLQADYGTNLYKVVSVLGHRNTLSTIVLNALCSAIQERLVLLLSYSSLKLLQSFIELSEPTKSSNITFLMALC